MATDREIFDEIGRLCRLGGDIDRVGSPVGNQIFGGIGHLLLLVCIAQQGEDGRARVILAGDSWTEGSRRDRLPAVREGGSGVRASSRRARAQKRTTAEIGASFLDRR